MKDVTLRISILDVTGDEADLEQIQRLRYQVYYKEMGLSLSGMDHARELLTDPLDVSAIHITAELGSDLVGAVRLNLNTVPHGLETPLEAFSLPRPFVYCSRLYVLQKFRGNGVIQNLARACFQQFSVKKAAVAICHCYPHLARLYERMGFQRYGNSFVVPGLEHLGNQMPYRC